MFFVFFVLYAVVSAAQDDPPRVTGTISNVTRFESYSFFRPKIDPLALTRDPIGDPDYWFLGDRAELGAKVEGRRFDLSGAFNYVRLENLPVNAIGPGGLGTGAFYYAASGGRFSYQLYMSELTATVKSADRRTSITVGRMPFSSGGEFSRPDSYLEKIRPLRLRSRMIGNFEWSLYQRRFDGFRFDRDRERWHFTAAAFVPTQGGFEESTNLSMPRVQIADVSIARKGLMSEAQAFAYTYRDRRDAKAVVDNSGSSDRPVDITVQTFGGSYIGFPSWMPLSNELDPTDFVAWGAVQTGDWYGQQHFAASASVELGHRWSSVPMMPWLRGGYYWSSGDTDPGDGRHGTFFAMLPSSRQYALSSVYAHMNLRDAFLQLAIEPRGFNARIEVHDVRVASAADLWYQGSGATASEGRFFGFSGRAAGGATSLGTVIEGTIGVPIRKHWSVGAYAATMSAGEVVRRHFTGKRLFTFSFDNVIRF